MTEAYIRILNNVTTRIYFNSFNLFNGIDLILTSSLPSWIINNTSGFGETNYMDMSPTITGSYVLTFSSTHSPPITDTTLYIEVVDSFYDSTDTCFSSESKCIVWITREGGRASMVFDQRINYSLDSGSVSIYENDNKLRYTSRGKNYEGVTLFKTGMSRDEIDLMESMRTSIQAWEYDDTTNTSTEIIFDSKSFDKYNTNEEFYESSIDYRYSKNKNIQFQ